MTQRTRRVGPTYGHLSSRMLAALFLVIVYLLQDIFHIDPLLGTSFLAATGCSQATAARGLETVAIDPLITPLEGSTISPICFKSFLPRNSRTFATRATLRLLGRRRPSGRVFLCQVSRPVGCACLYHGCKRTLIWQHVGCLSRTGRSSMGSRSALGRSSIGRG